jgi:hypothetical protein
MKSYEQEWSVNFNCGSLANTQLPKFLKHVPCDLDNTFEQSRTASALMAHITFHKAIFVKAGTSQTMNFSNK